MLPGLSVRDHFLLQISRANHMGLRHEARRDGKDCDEEASDQRSNRLPHITHCWESPLAICRQSNRGHIEFRKYERPKTFVITGRAAEFSHGSTRCIAWLLSIAKYHAVVRSRLVW